LGITERVSSILPEEFYAGLKLKRQLTTIEFAKLAKLLDSMEKEFGVEICYAFSEGIVPLYQRFLNRFNLDARMCISGEIDNRRMKMEKDNLVLGDPHGSRIECYDASDDSRLAEILDQMGGIEEIENIRQKSLLHFLEGRSIPRWFKELKDKQPPREALEAEFEHLREQFRPLLRMTREEAVRAAFERA